MRTTACRAHQNRETGETAASADAAVSPRLNPDSLLTEADCSVRNQSTSTNISPPSPPATARTDSVVPSSLLLPAARGLICRGHARAQPTNRPSRPSLRWVLSFVDPRLRSALMPPAELLQPTLTASQLIFPLPSPRQSAADSQSVKRTWFRCDQADLTRSTGHGSD